MAACLVFQQKLHFCSKENKTPQTNKKQKPNQKIITKTFLLIQENLAGWKSSLCRCSAGHSQSPASWNQTTSLHNAEAASYHVFQNALKKKKINLTFIAWDCNDSEPVLQNLLHPQVSCLGLCTASAGHSFLHKGWISSFVTHLQTLKFCVLMHYSHSLTQHSNLHSYSEHHQESQIGSPYLVKALVSKDFRVASGIKHTHSSCLPRPTQSQE